MRLTTRHAAAIAAVALGAATATTPPALASGDSIYGSVDCAQSPSAACDIAAGTRPNLPTTNGQHQSGTHDDSTTADSEFGCRYVPVDYPAPSGPVPEPGGWFMVLCSPDGKDPDSYGPVWVQAGATAPVVSPEQVAQTARKQLRLPAPAIAASPSDTQLVRLPTWLWLSGGWVQSSATASVPGVSVTAVASPVSVSWSMGDGTTVTCGGPGTPYQPGSNPEASSPDCGHTYLRSSAREPGQAFTVSATVQWSVTWSGAGQTGTFPDLTTTSTATFRVAESHALNNGTG